MPQACLFLRVTYFVGCLFSILRHFLNSIGDLVDGCGNQLHLLRLLLTLLVRLSGQTAECIRGGFQCAGGFKQLPDHRTKLGREGVEVAAKCGQFVVARHVEVTRQVGFAAGDVGHRLHGVAQWLSDTADEDGDQHRHQRSDCQADDRKTDEIILELRFDVVDVDPRTYDPAPWLEQLDIGDLRYGVFLAGLRPLIVNQAGTFELGNLDHLVEQFFAVRILNLGQILALKLGFHRMHDHDGLHVVDPEIVVLAIANQTNLIHCGFLCLGRRHAPVGFELLVIGQYSSRGLDDVLRHDLLAFVQVATHLLDHQQAKHEEHDHRYQRNQPEALTNREVS